MMPESSIDQRLSEHSAFREAVSDQSELGQILITGSFVDNQLRIILESFLVEGRAGADLLDGMNAPIGTFSARIQVAYALGLIDQREYDSITAIRRIRNEFAHKITTDFGNAALTKHFNKLAWAAGKDEVGKLDREEILMIASLRVALQLVNRADHAKASRLTAVDWPHMRIDVDPDADALDYIY